MNVKAEKYVDYQKRMIYILPSLSSIHGVKYTNHTCFYMFGLSVLHYKCFEFISDNSVNNVSCPDTTEPMYISGHVVNMGLTCVILLCFYFSDVMICDLCFYHIATP